jgi:hypothetical protein
MTLLPCSLLTASVLAAAPHPKAGAAASRKARVEAPVGKEVRVIPLDDKRAARVHVVRTAPGYPCTIEFPEPFVGAPSCGDCGDTGAGLFRLDAFNEGHYLTIKPRTFAGKQADGNTISAQDFVTVLTVRLQTYTLTIQVDYTDEPSRADPRVVFTLPQRPGESAYVQAELAKGRRALEEDLAAKVQRGAGLAFLRALAEPHSCNSLSDRVRHDDLVMEAKELCQFGGNYYLRFTIENRGRAAADIAGLSLKYGSGSALTAPTDLEHYLSNEHLEFQGKGTAVVGFRLGEGQARPRTFELTAHDSGTRARIITLAGIEP